MSRLLIVSYRPAPGNTPAVIELLRAQYRRALDLGAQTLSDPLLARSAAGELTYIVTFAEAEHVDRCWEDPDFQDLDARLAELADMIPMRSLGEASASYMDLEFLDPAHRAAEGCAPISRVSGLTSDVGLVSPL